MENWIAALLGVFGALLASSGFWAFVQTRDKQKNAQTRLLLGLAHDRIVFLGLSFVDRGWITKDEYEDYIKYLYEPYSEFGGNGLAERVMLEVKKLPMRGSHNSPISTQIIEEKNGNNSSG